MGYIINRFDDDVWTDIDEFDTREQAIQYCVEQYKLYQRGIENDLFFSFHGINGNISTKLFIGKKVPYTPYVDAEQIIEQVLDQAYCDCDMAADIWMEELEDDEIEDLQECMQKAFEGWMKRHEREPNFCNVTDVREIDVKDYV